MTKLVLHIHSSSIRCGIERRHFFVSVLIDHFGIMSSSARAPVKAAQESESSVTFVSNTTTKAFCSLFGFLSHHISLLILSLCYHHPLAYLSSFQSTSPYSHQHGHPNHHRKTLQGHAQVMSYACQYLSRKSVNRS